jgi:hypothetical protein
MWRLGANCLPGLQISSGNERGFRVLGGGLVVVRFKGVDVGQPKNHQPKTRNPKPLSTSGHQPSMSVSMVLANERSIAVIPPASCVDSVQTIFVYRMSISG